MGWFQRLIAPVKRRLLGFTQVDAADLLGSLPALRGPGVRIGLPDEPALITVRDLPQLVECLENALVAFQAIRTGTYRVCAYGGATHVYMKFILGPPEPGQIQPEDLRRNFETALAALFAIVKRDKGHVLGGDGGSGLSVTFPYGGSGREDWPHFGDMPWEQQYQRLLQRASWHYLRYTAFRFSRAAEAFAGRCRDRSLSRVLIPSVGLCVHPWQFADQGLQVVATDSSRTAMDAVAHPERFPQLYSQAAFEKYDLKEFASFRDVFGDRCQGMPRLEDPAVADALKRQVVFSHSDWAQIPLDDGSVDAIFATNALPRDSEEELQRVLDEWIRVVRPGGLVYLAMHNFFRGGVANRRLEEAGWEHAHILTGVGGGIPASILAHYPCTVDERCFTPGATTLFEYCGSSG